MASQRQVLCFGAFRLVVAERRLERDGHPVRLGDRPLDILLALLARPGEVIGKRELVERVWPGLHVEDGNLRVNLTTLRTALGDGRDGARYIANVHGRGYAFVAPVQEEDAQSTWSPAPSAAGLPPRLARMVGRDDQVADILRELDEGRFVSLVGPGGIGKTTVGVAVGHARLTAAGEAVRFVDLGALTDEAQAPGAVAGALDLAPPGEPTSAILNVLRDQRLLLVLDSCERVITAAATLAEHILRACPHVRILATSREPLRAEGERVHHLSSLAFPEAGRGLNAAAAAAFPAVQLLADRAAAASSQFILRDAEADLAGDICRRLGGVALAIELAGGRVGVIGLRETAAQLDSELALRWPGRRTAVPRHQTLNATLDWSYSVLTEGERAMLRRLSIFSGGFDLEAARAVASESVDPGQAPGDLANLVAKSLVAVETAPDGARFRLLDTTRAYARAKLAASGEAAVVSSRHAHSMARSWTRAPGDPLAPYIDLGRFKRQLSDIRAAIAWCFGEGGDPGCGARLAAGAAPALLELALWPDCELWTREALALGGELDSRTRLELSTSHAQAELLMERHHPGLRVELEEAASLAEALDEPHYLLRALISLQRFLTRNEDYAASLAVAERIQAAARAADHPDIALVGDLCAGMSRHFLGDQARACEDLRGGLRRIGAGDGLNSILFGDLTDFHAKVCLARSLWLTGLPDQATQAARDASAAAEALRVQGALGVSAIWVIQVHFWTGDWVAAQAMADDLLDLTRDHPNAPLRDLGLVLRGELLVRQGAPAEGVALLRRYLDMVRSAGRFSLMPTMTFVEGALALGDSVDALAMLEWSAAAAARSSYRLYDPEILRLRGEIAAHDGDLDAAQALFGAAIGEARRQAAPSWELRAALSQGRLLRRQGRPADAARAVDGPLERLVEGGWTRDQRDARAFLESLDAPAPRRTPADLGRGRTL